MRWFIIVAVYGLCFVITIVHLIREELAAPRQIAPTELCYESGYSVGYDAASHPEVLIEARAAVHKMEIACGVPAR